MDTCFCFHFNETSYIWRHIFLYIWLGHWAWLGEIATKLHLAVHQNPVNDILYKTPPCIGVGFEWSMVRIISFQTICATMTKSAQHPHLWQAQSTVAAAAIWRRKKHASHDWCLRQGKPVVQTNNPFIQKAINLVYNIYNIYTSIQIHVRM